MAFMSRAQLTAEAVYERREIEVLNQMSAAAARAKGEKAARIDTILTHGRYDREPSGFNRLYHGQIGLRKMIAQVAALGEDLAIGFWASEPGVDLHRCLLVTPDRDGRPTYWLEIGDRVVPCTYRSKYYEPAKRIVARRLYEMDRYTLTEAGMAATEQGTAASEPPAMETAQAA